MNTSTIVQKLWNYCNVLRDDLSACGHAQAGGMSYGDYVEAAPAHPCACGIRTSLFSTVGLYVVFKMADERTKAPYLLARGLSACDAQAGAQASNQKSLPARSAQVNPVPEKYGWPSLGNCSMRCSTSCSHAVVIKKDGDDLFDHYRKLEGSPAS
jgi:type I restriction enzyme M protein